MHIAVLEDDTAQVELMQSWLRDAGHECRAFASGSDFKAALKRDTFDLLVLDWSLPDTTGPEVLQWVRENIDWHIPVLFVTSRDLEEDIVYALEHGADDYMTKPVKQHETMARITALERRSQPAADQPTSLKQGLYVFDIVNRLVMIGAETVSLTNKEFDLALLLFRNPGRLLSRSYILENIWGTNRELSTRTVDTHISRIRNKLYIHPDNGVKLNAIYNHGYRLEPLSVNKTAAAS
ncbi:MAG: response regulator transcription factor [Gammaproteobacteria bacterium]